MIIRLYICNEIERVELEVTPVPTLLQIEKREIVHNVIPYCHNAIRSIIYVEVGQVPIPVAFC